MKNDLQEFVAAVAILVVGSIVLKLLYSSWKKRKEKIERNLIHDWLKFNSGEDSPKGHMFRSTRSISSNVNIPTDRVVYLCSIDERIFQSSGKKDDMWGLRENQP